MGGGGLLKSLKRHTGADNRWIKLRLVGTRSVRSAVGARVQVGFLDGEEERVVHRVIGTGGSFGANPLEEHVGLGRAERVRFVEVLWPSGGRQRHEDLPTGALVHIREGEGTPRIEHPSILPFAR